jgi:hypothetical protein
VKPTSGGEERGADASPKGRVAYRTLLAVAIIAGLILLNRWLFSVWLHTDYFMWYLENGALFSIVFGLVALARAKPDEAVGLISVNPARYLEAIFSLTTWPLLAMNAAQDAADYGRSFANILLLLPLSLALLISVWIFLLVGAPLQYFVHLVCGAPGRAIHEAKGVRSYWIFHGARVPMKIFRTPKGELPNDKELAPYMGLRNLGEQIAKVEEVAKTGTASPSAIEELGRLRQQVAKALEGSDLEEVTFEDQPVKLTAAFSALVLWIVAQFIR